MTLADALRYLQDLGWDAVYRQAAAAPHRPGMVEEREVDADSGRPTAASRAADSFASSASRPAQPAVALTNPVPAVPSTGVPAPAAAALVVPEGAPERARLLAEVAAEASVCQRCELARGRTHVVFASGDPDADLMIIGEGPGAQEDRQGLPFVGPAGELLTKILLAIERSRDQVYIANIVKCRPPQNRDPRPEEVAACRDYLDRQIDLVRPRVIVALGRVAAQTLLGNDFPVGRLRGSWWEVKGVPVRVTYHPAALLRDASLKRPTWEDMKIVRDRLRETTPA